MGQTSSSKASSSGYSSAAERNGARSPPSRDQHYMYDRQPSPARHPVVNGQHPQYYYANGNANQYQTNQYVRQPPTQPPQFNYDNCHFVGPPGAAPQDPQPSHQVFVPPHSTPQRGGMRSSFREMLHPSNIAARLRQQNGNQKIAVAIENPEQSSRLTRGIARQGSTAGRTVCESFDPRVLQKYEIRALIGKGSFSRVVRAEHRISRELYAIKLLECKGGTGPFENELAILSRVRHNNVIQLAEVFRTRHRIYMVMELASGGELYDRIVAEGVFTEQESARVLAMILDGITYLHHVGITHRDVKPENILYQHTGHGSKVMISDFGLAHIQQSPIDPVTMTTTCGTPEYISPELLLRQPYDNKVDLWATGVIAYILLSGVMPFDDDNRTRLYISIIRGRYKFYKEHWSDVSRAAREFVRSLLETDPDLRLSAPSAMEHPWLISLTKVPQKRSMKKSRSNSRARSRSSRSTCSISRSGHNHRIHVEELERLQAELATTAPVSREVQLDIV